MATMKDAEQAARNHLLELIMKLDANYASQARDLAEAYSLIKHGPGRSS